MDPIHGACMYVIIITVFFSNMQESCACNNNS